MENSGSSFSTLKTMPSQFIFCFINRAAFCPKTCYQQGRVDLASSTGSERSTEEGFIHRRHSWASSEQSALLHSGTGDRADDAVLGQVQGEKAGQTSQHQTLGLRCPHWWRTDRMTPRVPTNSSASCDTRSSTSCTHKISPERLCSTFQVWQNPIWERDGAGEVHRQDGIPNVGPSHSAGHPHSHHHRLQERGCSSYSKESGLVLWVPIVSCNNI